MKPVDVHNTIARNMLADGYSILFDLEKSHGVYFVDRSLVVNILIFSLSLPAMQSDITTPNSRMLTI
jgi:hypothetical protein